MTAQFADQLHAELLVIEAELERLEARRRLIEELLELESNTAATATATPARRVAPRPARTSSRRLPRGLISRTVREFLAQQPEPAHATEILAHLKRHDAAPQGAKPIANLQSNLQRMKEAGEIENVGRNRWRLRFAPSAGQTTPSLNVPRSEPSVITSTTPFSARPSAGSSPSAGRERG